MCVCVGEGEGDFKNRTVCDCIFSVCVSVTTVRMVTNNLVCVVGL